jgi:hypothetical protein
MTCPMTGGPMAGMGAMHGGPGTAGCPMSGGASGSGPKHDLTTLVQKLNLLTAGTLTDKQAVAVNNCLRDIEKSAKMTDDDAKAKQDQLTDALDEDQKSLLDAIGLAPKSAGGCCGMAGMITPNQNPFQEPVVGKAVKSLRERLAVNGTAAKAETPKASPPPAKAVTAKAPPAKADAPKAPPAKADASKSAAAKS